MLLAEQDAVDALSSCGEGRETNYVTGRSNGGAKRKVEDRSEGIWIELSLRSKVRSWMLATRHNKDNK